MKFSLITIVLISTVVAVTHRPIKIVAYPYIPDLANDKLSGLADFLQDRFYSDTGRRIEILFDLVHYATDTYTPNLVVDALTTGGYDMQEIDSIILGYLNEANVLQQIPSSVSFKDYTPQILKMVTDPVGTKWAHTSYTCTNIFFSYDASITGNHNGADFLAWMASKQQPGQKGWTGDLSSEPDLRLEYLDGWRDSHPKDAWYPNGYSSMLSQIDMGVINNIRALRDSCTDPQHINRCVSGHYYLHPDQWFLDFVNGGTVVLQGFPEYTSEILAIANNDVNNPTKLHTVAPALVGAGDKPYLFTDAWVISKSNCDADCQTTAAVFLNWQKANWAPLISLGLDLIPVRPRFLAVAYQPFYSSDNVDALPQWAQEYYQFSNHEINRAVALDTTKFWDTEASQSATIESLITVGFQP